MIPVALDPGTALLAVSAAHAGFSVVVSAVVYPALADAARSGPAGWAEVHDRHSRRISRVVAPLYVLVLVACGWALAGGELGAAHLVALTGNSGALLVTAVAAAPTHGRLGRDGPRPELLRRLLRADLARSACAVVAAAAALAVVLQA